MVALPEEAMFEPAWSEPLDLFAGRAEEVVSSSSSAASAANDPGARF